MIYSETFFGNDIVAYIKNIMEKEGVFYARAPIAINSKIFNHSKEFYRYPPRQRESGMEYMVKSGYLGKDIIVLYRTTSKSNINNFVMTYTASETDDEVITWSKSSKNSVDIDKWFTVSTPYIFFNINVIDFIDTEEVVGNDRQLFLHIKSYSGNTDGFSISKDEYDEIVERIKSLERYDILLRTGI